MSVFYVLDLDRTLANTERLYDVLQEVLERYTNVTVEMLNEERAAVESRGESFKMIHSLRHLLEKTRSNVDWEQIERTFIETALQTDGVLEPHALDLLEILDSKRLPYGIITYGNEAWQLAKIEAAGLLSVPHLVTRIKEKGHLLAGWQRSDGSFVIPPAMTQNFQSIAVDSIVFLDDKAISFKDIPEGVRGIFVRSPLRDLLPSQMGTLPEGVETVSGLRGAIDILFSEP